MAIVLSSGLIYGSRHIPFVSKSSGPETAMTDLVDLLRLLPVLEIGSWRFLLSWHTRLAVLPAGLDRCWRVPEGVLESWSFTFPKLPGHAEYHFVQEHGRIAVRSRILGPYLLQIRLALEANEDAPQEVVAVRVKVRWLPFPLSLGPSFVITALATPIPPGVDDYSLGPTLCGAGIVVWVLVVGYLSMRKAAKHILGEIQSGFGVASECDTHT